MINKLNINLNNVVLKPITKQIRVIYDDCKFRLPDKVQEEINCFWDTAVKDNPTLTRGTVFNIVENNINDGKIKVQTSDYAHYLWSIRKGKKSPYDCKIIFAGAVVKTSDDVLVFGEMAGHTAAPNIIQCAGGCVDEMDIVDGEISLYHTIKRELREEFFIDVEDEKHSINILPKYLKSGGYSDSLAVMFELKLNMDIEEFKQHYETKMQIDKKKGQLPEFSQLVCLPLSKESVDCFLVNDRRSRNDYLNILLLSELELNREQQS